MKLSGKIRSENATFKAFDVASDICLTLQKVTIIELLQISLVLVRTDNICIVGLCIYETLRCISTHHNKQKCMIWNISKTHYLPNSTKVDQVKQWVWSPNDLLDQKIIWPVMNIFRTHLNHEQHFTEGTTSFTQNFVWRHRNYSCEREYEWMNICHIQIVSWHSIWYRIWSHCLK